jgi:hypothetical protein
MSEIVEVSQEKVELAVQKEEAKQELDPNAITTLLKMALDDNLKVKMDISPNAKHAIEIVLERNPLLFNNIEGSIKNMTKDSKIDTNDIPDIILCVQQIYEIVCSVKKYSKEELANITSCIIKTIIHILVEERKIDVADDKKDAFLAMSDKLIDSCIALMRLPSIMKPPGCMKKLLGKKK